MIHICLSQYTTDYPFHLFEYESFPSWTKLVVFMFIVHCVITLSIFEFPPTLAGFLIIKMKVCSYHASQK